MVLAQQRSSTVQAAETKLETCRKSSEPPKTHRGVLPSTSLTTQHVQACNLLAADGTCPTKIQYSAGEATSSSSRLMTPSPECFVSMRSLPAIIQHTASKG